MQENKIFEVFREFFNIKEFDFQDEANLEKELVLMKDSVEQLQKKFKLSRKELDILKEVIEKDIFKLVMNQFCQLFFFFDLQGQQYENYLNKLKFCLKNNFQILSKFILYQGMGTKRLPFLISYLLFNELYQKQFFSSKSNTFQDLVFFCDFGTYFLLDVQILKKTIEIQIQFYTKENRKLKQIQELSKSLVDGGFQECNRFVDHPVFDQIDENRAGFRKIIHKYSQKLLQMKMHNNKIFEEKKIFFENLKNKNFKSIKSKKSKSEVVMKRLEQMQPQQAPTQLVAVLKRDRKIMNSLSQKLEKKIQNYNIDQRYQSMKDFEKNLGIVNKQYEQNMRRNFQYSDEPIEQKKSLDMMQVENQLNEFREKYKQKENRKVVQSHSIHQLKIHNWPKAVKIESQKQKKPFQKVQNLFDLFSQQKKTKNDEIFRKKKNVIEKIMNSFYLVN